jgi:cystathionine gamma-synthase
VGAIAGKKDLIGQVRALHNVLCGVVDPHAAYLLIRGMKTLEIRVQRQNESAMRLARALEAHPKIEKVHYPGLESHPDHAVAKKQMKGECRGELDYKCSSAF